MNHYRQNRIARERRLIASGKQRITFVHEAPTKEAGSYSFPNKLQSEVEAQWILDNVFKPIVDLGGSMWFSTFTFRRPKKHPHFWMGGEDLQKYIKSYMFTLARETQSTITACAGYWCEREDLRKPTHFHAVIASEGAIHPHLLNKIFRNKNGSLGLSEHREYDWGLDGLAYTLREHKHMEGVPMYSRPFTPPKNRHTGKLRKPRRIKRRINR
mgnify:CR=1 FL=1